MKFKVGITLNLRQCKKNVKGKMNIKVVPLSGDGFFVNELQL